MSDAQKQTQGQGGEAQAKEGGSILEQAIAATKQTDRSRTEELLRALTEEAMSGTVTFSKNITVTINKAIEALDAKLSKQLAVIMHSPEFTRLEGSWRGLHHLVMNSETGTSPGGSCEMARGTSLTCGA